MKKYARILIPRETFVDEEHIRTILDQNSNILDEAGEIYSYLDEKEYLDQLSDPDNLWKCPNTGILGFFDDSYFESIHNIE